MTVVFAGMLAQFSDEPALVFTTVMLAGGLLVVLGWLGVGRYVSLIPYPVISGFMSGIGVIIIILQLGPLLGHPAEGGVMPNLWALPTFLANPMFHAAALCMLTLAIVYGTPSVIGKLIPPPLLALIIGTLTAIFLFPNAPVIGAVPQGFPSVIVPTLRFDVFTVIIQGACVIALLCAIDSLLTSLVCDNMTRTQHNSDRELIGQGIGNMIAGMFGGLPGAGATVRSVANIRSGSQ